MANATSPAAVAEADPADDPLEPYDYLRGQHTLRVKSRVKDVGIYRPLHRWSFAGGVSLDPPEPRGELDLGDEPGA